MEYKIEVSIKKSNFNTDLESYIRDRSFILYF